MNCLCCGKSLKENEYETGWHKACIKKFFGTSIIPEIEIDNETLKLLADETTNKGYTVPGVQKKLSLHLMSGKQNPRLTLVNYPTGYILKPQVEEYTALPESEHLIMCMAEATGISAVPHALIKGADSYAYITKRVDRCFSKNNVKLLAMEDFCQLDLRLTQDKYKGSYERCSKLISRYSNRKGLDMSELFLRLVFCFVTGNSDMHLKNFSLIETDEGSRKYVLSPAYDLLPVNIILPSDKEQFALSMNGKKQNIRKKDFLVFAEGCGLTKIQAENMIKKVVSLKNKYIEMTKESLIPAEMKEALIELICKRLSVFE